MGRYLDANARWIGISRADLVAGIVLLGACILWSGLTWGRLYDPIVDQGWQMQAAARVASGQILYRDLIWMYGPLPVYLLALLFHWLGTGVTPFLLLIHVLAALGCLLTYCIARFLLKPALAFLGTLALFLGGWWGGFIGYTQSYTGAVPLGAVAGLVFVACLLAYLRGGRLLWLALAGIASGAAVLTKPEFGLACAGTGLVILTGLALFPRGLAGDRGSTTRALGCHTVPIVVVAGVGYGTLASLAGWDNVWLGLSGYDQDAILLQEWPPWGTPESWLFIVSGLGIYILAGISLIVLAAPAAARKRSREMILLGALGLAMALLPWRNLAGINPGLIAAMRSSWPVLIEQGIRILWAPGTVLLTILLIVLGTAWIRAHLRGQPLSLTTGYLCVLVLYTALADVRSYLYPTGTFHFLYLDTLFPVLVFLVAVLLPLAAVLKWRARVHGARLDGVLMAAILAYAVAGLAWDLDYFSQQDTRWDAPRGTALYNASHERRKAWPGLLQQILEYTEVGDPVAVLGQEPGFYFWTGRRNPLRQDTLLPRMESSPEDAQEIVNRFERDVPRLIAIPQGVTHGRGWFWELEVGRQAYEDLAPVWEYVRHQYRFRTLVGGETWGYAVYERKEQE
jgi:hypothetical protein